MTKQLWLLQDYQRFCLNSSKGKLFPKVNVKIVSRPKYLISLHSLKKNQKMKAYLS